MQEIAVGGFAVAVGEQAVMADAVEPLGGTCVRKRRINSCVASVMVLKRPGPSTQ
jgi:hypothetical protein